MSQGNQIAFILNEFFPSYMTCATLLLLITCTWMPFEDIWGQDTSTVVVKLPKPGAKSIIVRDRSLCFCYLFLLFDWVHLIPLLFAVPLYTHYSSHCFCARSHSWPPLSVYASLNTSPPNSSSSPLTFDTLSPLLPVRRLVLYCLFHLYFTRPLLWWIHFWM